MNIKARLEKLEQAYLFVTHWVWVEKGQSAAKAIEDYKLTHPTLPHGAGIVIVRWRDIEAI